MSFEPNPWEHPIGDPLHQDRDIEKNHYDRQEARVACYLFDLGAGGGDDPVGFLITSNRWMAGELGALRKVAQAARHIHAGPTAQAALDAALEELDAWQNPFGKDEPKP